MRAFVSSGYVSFRGVTPHVCASIGGHALAPNVPDCLCGSFGAHRLYLLLCTAFFGVHHGLSGMWKHLSLSHLMVERYLMVDEGTFCRMVFVVLLVCLL